MTKFKTNIPDDFGKGYQDKHCYTPVHDEEQGYRVAKVTYNEVGYQPLGKANPNDPHELDKFVGTYDYAKSICDTWNKRLGISSEEELRIVASSMEMHNG